MKRIMSFTLALPLLIIVPAGLSACATTQSVGEQTDDLQIKSRVGRRLTADPEVARFEIDVDVQDGVVTLRGEVDNQTTVDEAIEIAKNTEGVERVVNQLQLEEGDGEIADGDLGIRTQVGTRLMADPDVRRFNIDVDVVDGVVYLSGVVHDQEAKDAAERIATRVEGVVNVENELEVSPKDEPLSTDSAVQEDAGEGTEDAPDDAAEDAADEPETK